MNALETIRKGLSDLVAEMRRRLRRPTGDGAFGAPSPGELRAETFATPKVDIYETPEHVAIFADLPGVKPAALRVEALRDRLEIRAVRADRTPAGGPLAALVPDGYRATYQLHPSLDPDRIDAKLRDGVLRLIIPRSEASRPRRVEVKSAS